MRSVRCLRFVAIPAMLTAASVCLLFATNEVAPPASAQSGKPADLTGALMGLHHEFPETLHKITPELLRLQQQLVDELGILQAGTREEERVGQRTIEDVINVTEYYFRELEALQVMTARSRKEAVTEHEILEIRIERQIPGFGGFQKGQRGNQGPIYCWRSNQHRLRPGESKGAEG